MTARTKHGGSWRSWWASWWWGMSTILVLTSPFYMWGCVTPIEKAAADAKSRLVMTEAQSSTQKLMIEACDELRDHASRCAGKCRLSAPRHAKCKAVAKLKTTAPLKLNTPAALKLLESEYERWIKEEEKSKLGGPGPSCPGGNCEHLGNPR